jgi:23S rRNA (cytosine1962-C5)-methyltransferase
LSKFIKIMDANLEMFKNRFTKMYRHFSKWARKQGISCFRIYDCDIPQFPIMVDYYDRKIYVAVYEKKAFIDGKDTIDLYLNDVIDIIGEVTEIEAYTIFVKNRMKQKGNTQYTKLDDRKSEFVIKENGLEFMVNLSDYVDTGLFLDHRLTRKLIQEKSEGKSVLNLFAYTGSFSVYAAEGGATNTMTMDMSKTYLDWAKMNMKLNGFVGPKHKYLQTNVLEWLKEPVEEVYDLIILDPPTFSNSKKMYGTFEIQRDHEWLIRQTMKHLDKGGLLLFSNNYKKFKLETKTLEATNIKDITAMTTPPDFADRIHRCCFLIEK